MEFAKNCQDVRKMMIVRLMKCVEKISLVNWNVSMFAAVGPCVVSFF